VHGPGIEPGSRPWPADVLPLDHSGGIVTPQDDITVLYCGVQHFIRIIQVDKSEEKVMRTPNALALYDGQYPDETIIGSNQYGISIISNKNLLF